MIKSGAKATKEAWRDNYITPAYILERVSLVLGDMWFDPCPPNPSFNGLALTWPDETYINPPFSKIADWVRHGLTQPAPQIYLATNATETRWFQMLVDACDLMCLMDHRTRFIDPRTMQQAANPERACVLFFRGDGFSKARFRDHFASIGKIIYLT